MGGPTPRTLQIPDDVDRMYGDLVVRLLER
jgi:hypothetical protein